MKMAKLAIAILALSALCLGQVKLDEGTPVRVRLEQTLSSATAEKGQTVDFTVSDDVKVGNLVVIAQGAPASGEITEAQPKRRMGRAGKLDFSIDRVKAVDGSWIPLRYSPEKRTGSSNATSTGIIAGGLVVALGPVGALMLLRHGKDVEVSRGTSYTVFTDQSHALTQLPPTQNAMGGMNTGMAMAPAGGQGSVHIVAPVSGADIEVDGNFVGNAPATLNLPAGVHTISVRKGNRSWERRVEIMANSQITLNAHF